MSDRTRDRTWENNRWVNSRPGAPSSIPRGSARIRRRYLTRPITVLVTLVVVATVVTVGTYALFGYGGPGVDANHDAVAGQLDLDGTICCITPAADSPDLAFVPVLDDPGFFGITAETVSLRTVRLSDDGEPEQIATLDAPGESVLPHSIAQISDTLYVPISRGDESSLWIVDVADPASPEEIGFIELEGEAVRRVASTDAGELLVQERHHFTIYDVTSPTEPVEIATINRSDAAGAIVSLDGDYLAYHVLGTSEVGLISTSEAAELGRGDVSSATRPSSIFREGLAQPAADREERLKEIAPTGNLHDITIADEMIYAAVSDQGIEILSVETPDDITHVGQIDLDGRAVRVATDGDQLFVLAAQEESRERLSYAVHQFELNGSDAPRPVQVVDDIRAVPGLQRMHLTDDHLLLGLNDTVVVVDIQ